MTRRLAADLVLFAGLLVLSLYWVCSTPRGANAASWPEYGNTPDNASASSESWLTPALAGRLVEQWHTPLGEASTSTPIVVNDTVFVATIGGEALAVALHTGQVYWRTQLDGPVFVALMRARSAFPKFVIPGRV